MIKRTKIFYFVGSKAILAIVSFLYFYHNNLNKRGQNRVRNALKYSQPAFDNCFLIVYLPYIVQKLFV